MALRASDVRTAIAARQADDWLRLLPQGWGLEDIQAGNRAPYADGLRVRDRAQADNIRWILDREGPDSRILVFAANLHTVAAPMTIAAISGDEEPPVVAGTYLERWLGDDYFPIGNPSAKEPREGAVRLPRRLLSAEEGLRDSAEALSSTQYSSVMSP